jgi:hypothetical protein
MPADFHSLDRPVDRISVRGHSGAVEAVVSAGALTAAFAALGLLATALFRLDGKMEAGFARLDQKIGSTSAGLADRMDQRFDRVDQRFDRVDQRFDRVDQRSERVDQHFERVEARLSALEIDVARHVDRHG